MHDIDPRALPPKAAIVHPIRKDGRHPVTFVFPVSDRRIKKLIRAADLERTTAGYVVTWTAR